MKTPVRPVGNIYLNIPSHIVATQTHWHKYLPNMPQQNLPDSSTCNAG
jgi:hypothetical protein